MNVLILDGFLLDNDLQSEIISYLQNLANCSVPNLSELQIAPCLGCFNCWSKSPGVCAQNDDFPELMQKFLLSEIVIVLTPIQFGGYSAQVKKALDRLLPILLPYFTKLNKETHHKPRYAKYPKFAAIGVIPRYTPRKEQQAQIFRLLVRRNSINFYTIPKAEGEHVLVVEDGKNLQKKIAAFMEELQ